MNCGYFYFMDDKFFEKYDKDKRLLQNKETVNGAQHCRPCFYALPDSKIPDILWFVPISSRLEKYEAIYNAKIQKQIEKGMKYPHCNTIRFGRVLGRKKAFLIQNMFPASMMYVSSIYIDKNTNNPVTIAPDVQKDISKNARDVLKLAFRGINLTFADIVKIYNDISAEAEQEHEKNRTRNLTRFASEFDEDLEYGP